MMADDDKFHQWLERALKEAGDVSKEAGYQKYRVLMRKYFAAERMKKFLKVGDYEEKK